MKAGGSRRRIPNEHVATWPGTWMLPTALLIGVVAASIPAGARQLEFPDAPVQIRSMASFDRLRTADFDRVRFRALASSVVRDDPWGVWIHVSASRVTLRGDRRIVVKERAQLANGHPTFDYRFDPVTWGATASGTIRTSVVRQVFNYVDGYGWLLLDEKRIRKGSAEVALRWWGEGVPRARPEISVGSAFFLPFVWAWVEVSRDATVHGSIRFEGFGRTVDLGAGHAGSITTYHPV